MCVIIPDQKPLRLLMAAETSDAAWANAVHLARGLSDHGLDITFVVLGSLVPEQRSTIAAALTLIELGDDLQGAPPTPVDVDVQGIRIAMLTVERRPDLVHLHNPALAANPRFPCPLVVTVAPMPLEPAWYVEMTTRGYAAADAVITPDAGGSEAMIAQALAVYRELLAAVEQRRGGAADTS